VARFHAMECGPSFSTNRHLKIFTNTGFHLKPYFLYLARVDLLRFNYLQRVATLPADSILSIIITVSTTAHKRLIAASLWAFGCTTGTSGSGFGSGPT
jgi:hypothetical protein